MFRSYINAVPEKIYLIFHSYELLIILWLCIGVFSLSNYWKALAIGLTQHVLFDQMTNPLKPFGYFLVFRAFKNFDRSSLIRTRKEQL